MVQVDANVGVGLKLASLVVVGVKKAIGVSVELEFGTTLLVVVGVALLELVSELAFEGIGVDIIQLRELSS